LKLSQLRLAPSALRLQTFATGKHRLFCWRRLPPLRGGGERGLRLRACRAWRHYRATPFAPGSRYATPEKLQTWRGRSFFFEGVR